MKILITGGAGFIGSHLTLRLLQEGHEMTILDNLLPQIHGKNPSTTSPTYKSVADKVNFIHGDVTRTEDWKQAISGQDVIVHLASETGTGQSMYEVSRYTEVNVNGTAKMLDVLVNDAHSIKKVILASSRAVYGEGKYNHPIHGTIYPRNRHAEHLKAGKFDLYDGDGTLLQVVATDEESLLQPTSIYGITKQVQEQMMQLTCSSLKIPSVILRFQNVYGEGQSLVNAYTGILSIFSNQILSGQSLNIFEDGLESRDFVHISDVVEALYQSISCSEADYQIFNVGTGSATTVLQVAELLRQNYGKNVDINVSGQFRVGDIRHNYADINKINATLNFMPKISFEEGLQRFCGWVLKQHLEMIDVEASLQEMKGKGLLQ